MINVPGLNFSYKPFFMWFSYGYSNKELDLHSKYWLKYLDSVVLFTHTHTHTHTHTRLVWLSFCYIPIEKIMRNVTFLLACEGWRFWCLPPVWNLRAVSLIPLFCISSLVLALSLFLSCPFLLLALFSYFFFPKSPFFLKVGSFVWLYIFFWAVRRWVL